MASLFGSLLGIANQRQEGQIQGQQLLRQYAAQDAATKLAQRKQSFEEMLQQAQIGNYQSEIAKRQHDMDHPKPNYISPVIGPNGEVQLVNKDDPMHPIKVPGIKGRIEYPPKYVAEPGSTGKQPMTKEAYILKRLPVLTKGTKGIGGLPQPGMSVDDATNQAGLEYDKANGVPKTAPKDHSGNIDPDAAQPEFDQAASLYQQALKQPGIDPEHVRQVYNTAVAKIARKHGMLK